MPTQSTSSNKQVSTILSKEDFNNELIKIEREKQEERDARFSDFSRDVWEAKKSLIETLHIKDEKILQELNCELAKEFFSSISRYTPNEAEFYKLIASQPEGVRKEIEKLLENNNNVEASVALVEEFLKDNKLKYYIESDADNNCSYIKIKAKNLVVLIPVNEEKKIYILGEELETKPLGEIEEKSLKVISLECKQNNEKDKNEVIKMVKKDLVEVFYMDEIIDYVTKKIELEKNFESATINLHEDIDKFVKDILDSYDKALKEIDTIVRLAKELEHTEPKLIPNIAKDIDKFNEQKKAIETRKAMISENKELFKYAKEKGLIAINQDICEDIEEFVNLIRGVIQYDLMKRITQQSHGEVKEFLEKYDCLSCNDFFFVGVKGVGDNLGISEKYVEMLCGIAPKDFKGEEARKAYATYSKLVSDDFDRDYKSKEFAPMSFVNYVMFRAIEIYANPSASKEDKENAEKIVKVCIDNCLDSDGQEKAVKRESFDKEIEKKAFQLLIDAAIYYAYKYRDAKFIELVSNKICYDRLNQQDVMECYRKRRCEYYIKLAGKTATLEKTSAQQLTIEDLEQTLAEFIKNFGQNSKKRKRK